MLKFYDSFWINTLRSGTTELEELIKNTKSKLISFQVLHSESPETKYRLIAAYETNEKKGNK